MLQQKRMDALWRLASDYALGDRSIVHEALGLGAALLVPGHAFGARFGRVLGGDRIAIEDANDERLAVERSIGEGEVTADERHRAAIASVATMHWNGADGSEMIVPFSAGNALYVLSFWSPAPAPRPFIADDEAFAENIALLIGSRVQHRWDAVSRRSPLEIVTIGGGAG